MFTNEQTPYALEKAPGYYPPANTGMRGSHCSCDERRKVWHDPVRDSESYDLIAVRAGVSGLSAAFFYRQQVGPKAKILVSITMMILVAMPSATNFTAAIAYSLATAEPRRLLARICTARRRNSCSRIWASRWKRFESCYDQNFYKSRGMGQGISFDKETFGVDRLVIGGLENPSLEFLAKTPLSQAAQKDILRLYTAKSRLSGRQKSRREKSLFGENELPGLSAEKCEADARKRPCSSLRCTACTALELTPFLREICGDWVICLDSQVWESQTKAALEWAWK
jgi:hypothetical protein